jgi:hypothetical protein
VPLFSILFSGQYFDGWSSVCLGKTRLFNFKMWRSRSVILTRAPQSSPIDNQQRAINKVSAEGNQRRMCVWLLRACVAHEQTLTPGAPRTSQAAAQWLAPLLARKPERGDAGHAASPHVAMSFLEIPVPTDSKKSLRKTPLSLAFLCVCPEPVLVNGSVLV